MEPVTMTLKKETQGTFVFATSDPFAAVSSVYLKKVALGRNADVPEKITLTIEVG